MARTVKQLRSPLQWFGGKGNFTQNLLPLIPEHHCYCEVFGGAGSLLFAKEPSKVEVYNDVDGDVVAFFKLFHNETQLERFQYKCRYTPYSRETFLDFRDTWKSQTDPLERIYRWFILNRMAFSAMMNQPRTGCSMSGLKNTARSRFHDYVDNLGAYAERLRGVQIDNRLYDTVINTYDSSATFFYLDPPYLPDTRSHGGYAHEMTLDDHERLVERLKSVEGLVLLSGYPNDLYESLGWHRADIETVAYSGLRKGDKDNKSKSRTECLWRNYVLPDESTQLELI